LNKITTYLVAALFAASSVTAFAAKHAAAEKDMDKKPTAAECKKDPKMKGCDDMKDMKKK